MPSFADLKDRASKAKDSGVSRFNSTRNKYTSASSKDMDWDPNHKAPPVPPPSAKPSTSSPRPTFPPPPPRTGQPSRSSTGPPPPVARDTRPDYVPPPSYASSVPAPRPPPRRTTSTQNSPEEIDWANLSQEDKDVFFSWLDEFFSRYLNISLPTSTSQADEPAAAKAPPLPVWSRPT